MNEHASQPTNEHAADGPATATVEAEVHPRTAPVAVGATPVAAGVVTTGDGLQATFMTEEQYLENAEIRQSPTLPLMVIGIGAFGAIMLGAIGAIPGGGFVGALGAVFGTIVTVVIGSIINSCVGWVVARLFGVDLGTVPEVIMRYAAVTAAYTLILVAGAMIVGPLIAMLFSLPALLFLAVWMGGLDFFQAMIFTAFVAMVNWILMSVMMLGAVTAAGM